MGFLGVFSGLSSGVILSSVSISLDLSVGIQSVLESIVGEGIVLLNEMENFVGLGNSDFGLDFVTVDDSGDIGVGQDGSLEGEVFSFDGGISVGSEHAVEGGEGALGPDDESAELTSGGEF